MKKIKLVFKVLALLLLSTSAFAAVTSNPTIGTAPVSSIPTLAPATAILLAIMAAGVLYRSRDVAIRLMIVSIAATGAWTYRDEIVRVANAVPPTVDIAVATATTTPIPLVAFCVVHGAGAFDYEAGVYNSTSTDLTVTSVTIPAGVTELVPVTGVQCTTSTNLAANGSSASPECYVRVSGTC